MLYLQDKIMQTDDRQMAIDKDSIETDAGLLK